MAENKYKLQAADVKDLVKPMGYCIASDRITVDGAKVGFMYREEKEDEDPYRYTEHYSEFWPYKVVQKLNEIDANYVKHFINTYTIDDNKAAIAFKRLIDANNQKKYKMITSTLNTTKNLINA